MKTTSTNTTYMKPTITLMDTAEGVYMSSGSVSDSDSAGSKYHCESKYMNGVYQQPTWKPIEDGYKIGRGCEGCPAANGTCRFVSAPEQMNWDGDFRPSWEVAGHLPDEKGY